MGFLQSTRLALKSLARSKMRSFLTMLGIIIGVAAVITLVSCIQGINTIYRMMNQANGANRIDMSYWGGRSSVQAQLIDYLEADERLDGYSLFQQSQGTIKYRNTELENTRLYFGNQNYADCTNLILSIGRNISVADYDRDARVCVIGEAVRKKYFGAMSPLGQSIKVNGVTLEIIGVFRGKYGGKLNTDDQMILIPYGLRERCMENFYDDYSIVARGTDSQSVMEFCTDIEKYMQPLATNNFGYSDFYVYSNEQNAESTQQYTNMLSAVAAGVAGISLLVGGIGIMNIMLVSVTERTREIGIRTAIGARRRDIIGQFLIEAAVVSASGGVIGIIIGTFGSIVGGNIMFSSMFNSPYMPQIENFMILPSVGLVMSAFLFSALLGIVFGIYPANKASKLQPVEALRVN